MAKKKENVTKDIYEQEYGPMQTIYVEEAAQKQLNGDERYGKWYLTRRYSTSPTTRFCIRTRVPERSLEKGFFHPQRFEPEIAAERCERVSKKELAQAAKKDPIRQKIEKIKNLKSGDKFAYKNVGYGTTVYEKGENEVWRRKGKLFTPSFDSTGMEWAGETWRFDGGLGLKTYIVLLEDVPEGELAD